MPSISKKGQAMPASPIRKLVPYSEAAKKKRQDRLSPQHWSTGYCYTSNGIGCR